MCTVNSGFNALRATATLALIAIGGSVSAQQDVESVNLKDIRGMRYCEFLLIHEDRVVIYNTSANDGCPEDKWQAMDAAALAVEFGAKAAQLNGPKFWAIDEQTMELGDTKTFGGIDARYAATLPISAVGSGEGSDPYVFFTSSKIQTLVIKAGKPVFDLVDPEGNTYALNAYGAQVQGGDPANLAGQLTPPEGWRFQVTTPNEDLVIEASTDGPVHMVGDDLHQYYTRYGSAVK